MNSLYYNMIVELKMSFALMGAIIKTKIDQI